MIQLKFLYHLQHFLHLENQIILDEGGDTLGSVIGAMTIGIDLQKQGPFDHIFVDAGSGLSAVGLLISLNFLAFIASPLCFSLFYVWLFSFIKSKFFIKISSNECAIAKNALWSNLELCLTI